MIQYIFNFLGVSYQQGSIEYYLVLITVLQVFLSFAICLVKYLTSPIDILSKGRK